MRIFRFKISPEGVMGMEDNKKKACGTGGWGIKQKNPSNRKMKLPPIWPGVYVWLLAGVLLLILNFFS